MLEDVWYTYTRRELINMAKPKISPRERDILAHFENDNTDFIGELQNLEGVVSEAVDVLYRDAVIGQEKETIQKRIEELEENLYNTTKQLMEFKKRNSKKKTSKKLIIR